MYLKYVNGCVTSSLTGLPGSFKPLFFCDAITCRDFQFDNFSGFVDDEGYSSDDLPDEPFDYDFDF